MKDANPQSAIRIPQSGFGTILTGEMFTPILADHIARYNRQRKTKFTVLGVPNTYFGGDVAVAGLLTGQDYLNVKDRIVGDFAVIPKHTIKSDEPILLDGISFDDLKCQFPVPIYDLDTNELIEFLSKS
jgi:NifB/MoaA-like Fe-S oxidoreductase